MFESLPIITEDNFTVFSQKEFSWFCDLMSGAFKSAESVDEAIDLACSELQRNNNIYLVKAIKGGVYGVMGEIEEEVEEEVKCRAGLATIPGILVILRLVDRAIEAQKLQAQHQIRSKEDK